MSKIGDIAVKVRDYGLANPDRLAEILYLHFARDVSVAEADVLGLLDSRHAPFSAYLFEKDRAGVPGAVPPDGVRLLEEDKLRFAERAAQCGIQTPEILCVLGARADVDSSWQGLVLESEEAFSNYVSSAPDLDCICKPARGGEGWDILALRSRNGQLIPPTPYPDARSFFRHLVKRNYSMFSWVVQRRELPHPDLGALMPGPGLGTVRIHSALAESGEVLLARPVLKIPKLTSISDNWLGGRRGGLLAPIDLDSGVLGKAVGYGSGQTRAELFARHYETGALIERFRLPFWDETRSAVRHAARCMRELPALGWDVAITARGPVVIEANWQFCFLLPQTAFRIGLRKEFLSLFEFTCGVRTAGVSP
jgi:hypothetical protein